MVQLMKAAGYEVACFGKVHHSGWITMLGVDHSDRSVKNLEKAVSAFLVAVSPSLPPFCCSSESDFAERVRQRGAYLVRLTYDDAAARRKARKAARAATAAAEAAAAAAEAEAAAAAAADCAADDMPGLRIGL